MSAPRKWAGLDKQWWTRSRQLSTLLGILFFALWFGTLNVRDLIRTDETRYAEIPREMLASGDWVTPRLSDLKYFEKPPLQYWATATAYTLFGVAPWTARLWTALCGALAIWLTWFTMLRLGSRRQAHLAAGILASSLFWIGGAHINSLDMGLSCFMHAALCCLLLAQQARYQNNSRTEKSWLLACWTSMALAVMSKGLIGIVLPGAVLLLYVLCTRDWVMLARLNWWRGLAVFFVITAPWFVLVSLRNPEFPEFFFIHEHFQRFVSKGHRREGPLWYFVPILLIGLMPWTTLLIQTKLYDLRRLIWPTLRTPQNLSPSQRNTLLLWLWCGLILVFFSVSSSKLPGYILPIFPALAMLIAPQLAHIRNTQLRWHCLAIMLITAIFAGALALLYPQQIAKDLLYRALYIGYAQILVGCLALLVVGSGLAAWYAQRARQRHQSAWRAWLTLGITSFIAGHGILLGHQVLAPSSSAKVMVSKLDGYLEADTPLYCVDTFEHGLLFYTERACTLVITKDEMYLGVAQEPHKYIPDLAGFVQRWQDEHKAIALVHPGRVEELKQIDLPFKEVFRDERRVLIVK